MASTYLTRTPGSAGNRAVWTWSGWLKFSTFDSFHPIFTAGDWTGGSTATGFILYQGSFYTYWNSPAGGTSTSAKFRDVNGWYHVVLQANTSTLKLYVNNVEMSSKSISGNGEINNTSEQAIGRYSNATSAYFDGQMAHVHFTDGTAYSPSDFGETDATTGIWKPKTAPSVTYGTNGFFLKFENSGAFGTDSSGNANNFTVNGTMTQTIDTPSNVFATLNPLKFTGGTLSNGNLQLDSSSNSWKTRYSTLGVSAGKYYMEFKMGSVTDDQSAVSIVSDNTLDGNVPGVDANASPAITYLSNGTKLVNGTASSSYFSAMSSNDIIGIALDMDGGTVQFYKNGSTTGSAINLSDAFTSSNYPLFFCGGVFNTRNIQANFGNGYFGTTAVSSAENPDDGIGIFEYAVPTGYKALCTKSINAQEYD